MTKSELRTMIQEMVKEELAGQPLKEAAEAKGPGYVIKAWDNPEMKRGTPSFDSEKDGIVYPEFDDVVKELSGKLSDLGAYEIIWIQSGN